jgi:hypothetical protein
MLNLKRPPLKNNDSLFFVKCEIYRTKTDIQAKYRNLYF